MTILPEEIEAAVMPQLPADLSAGIGCVGAGFIMADCHLVAYREHGLHPVAITSARPVNAERVAQRHRIQSVCPSVDSLVLHPDVRFLDIAVPPDQQANVIQQALDSDHVLQGILAQKPLGRNYAEALQIVEACEKAGVVLAVNQNMRWDHSVRGCATLLQQAALGEPVLATIDMRAIPHWMPWQKRQGWVTLRIMSIHHLDTFRYWLGTPKRIFASVRPDPRTEFDHNDGIALYILEYENGVRASSCDDVWAGPAREGAASEIGINWRLEGTKGIAAGTIGWPDYPTRAPSTLRYSTTSDHGQWHEPKWEAAWFPDAFIGPMADLMLAVEENRPPLCSGRENLETMALVDAAYLSAAQHRAVDVQEIIDAAEASDS